MDEIFHKIAVKVSARVGSSSTFALALVLVVSWFTIGISRGFTDSWLLLINTVSSVTTFLIVFLIQNSQNRQSRAMQLKLDELLKAGGRARTDLVNLESLTDKELDDLEDDFKRLRLEFLERQAKLIERRAKDAGSKANQA